MVKTRFRELKGSCRPDAGLALVPAELCAAVDGNTGFFIFSFRTLVTDGGTE